MLRRALRDFVRTFTSYPAYEAAYSASLKEPEKFWVKASQEVQWFRPPTKILDQGQAPTFYRWFVDGELNTCYNALDYHVQNGRGKQNAIIYDSPVTQTKRKITYSELLDEVNQLASVLKSLGVDKGDRVVIYMPMIPEAVIGVLACARIGAPHSVVFGGFASAELAKRIDDARPKIILSASCGIEPKNRIVHYKPLLDQALKLSKFKPQKNIIFQRSQAKCTLNKDTDLDWTEMIRVAGKEKVSCEKLKATDPLYILYTSGSTGTPKGIVRDNGGHAVALKWSMSNIYGMKPGEVFWAGSDIGWVVGHSYIIYGPLLHGLTSILYEGKPVGTPDASAFWRVLSEHKVNTFFTSPTALRAVKMEDVKGELVKKFDLSAFRCLFLAGEGTDPDTLQWAQNSLQKPVIDNWWQTETGWPIVSNFMGLDPMPVKAGSATKPVPGFDVRIVDDSGKEVKTGVRGNVVVKLPLPPGCLPTLYNNDERFIKAYLKPYPGYYDSMDAGHKDEDGYVFIDGRTDDVINIAGHRLTSAQMEAAIKTHPDVGHACVIGVKDSLKGHIPIGLVILDNNPKSLAKDHKLLEKELVQIVRDEVGPVAALKQICVVKKLPKNLSGKWLRGLMRAIADDTKFTTPASIEDITSLDEVASALQKKGYAKNYQKVDHSSS